MLTRTLARRFLPVLFICAVLLASLLARSPLINLRLQSACGYAGYGGGPTVSNVSPTSGAVSGGTNVTITGTGFCDTPTSVSFGTNAATNVVVVTDTQITATSPAGSLGTVDVTVTTAGGTSATSPADQFTYTLITQYFNWYDTATNGMVGDNIHLLNTSGSTAHITVALSGAASIPVTLASGAEQHVSFGKGHIGGPVIVTSDQPILASQRVQYFQSFNEVWAESATQAAKTLYLPWFDRATPGMVGDNIHVLNPGSTSTNVTVNLPGAIPAVFSLGAGAEQHVTFGAGHIGGPVVITSTTQPVLAAHSAFNWFDRATPGMVGDNIHLVNPGGSTATGTVALAGAPTQNFSIPAGGQTHVTFPAGHIGGPVVITSSQPVLATQRVQYFKSFNEVPSEGPPQLQAVNHIMWFDKATPGMVGDNIHLLNPDPTNTATGTITLPGASSIPFSVGPGQEAYYTFAKGHIGGPVVITVTSGPGILAAQRVQYFQSFNEVWAE
jgi:hypothetical protein